MQIFDINSVRVGVENKKRKEILNNGYYFYGNHSGHADGR